MRLNGMPQGLQSLACALVVAEKRRSIILSIGGGGGTCCLQAAPGAAAVDAGGRLAPYAVNLRVGLARHLSEDSAVGDQWRLLCVHLT